MGDSSNAEREIAAWLFSSTPYTEGEEWHVLPVKVDPWDWDGDLFAEGWKPDKKDLTRVLRQAKAERLTRLGNVHTHPTGPAWEAHGLNTTSIQDQLAPSDVDLKMMRRFKQVVRGVIAVHYQPETYRTEADALILGILFHDQHGKTIAEWRDPTWDWPGVQTRSI